jgi:predicted acyl esterase
MKRILFGFIVTFSANSLFAQVSNNNGQLDNLEELSTKFTIPITMPDGIELMTDVYLPILRDSLLIDVDILGTTVPIQILKKGVQFIMYDSINGQPNPNPYQLPMVFSRTPYNKGSWDGLASPINMLGYCYAVQDMRGRYTSKGVYMPLYSDGWSKDPYHPTYGHVLDVTPLSDPRNGNKHEDGYNSIQQILNQNWLFDNDQNGIPETTAKLTNGRIGMFGASALGYNQYQAAAARKINPDEPGIKCLVPIVATQEFYKSTGFQNGVFRDRLVNGWLKGQIFTGTDDDLNEIDNDIDNDLHSATDYGLPNKFVAAANAIDHFASVRYLGGPAGYYPNSVGRGDMDATHAPVNAQGLGDKNGTISRYTNMETPAYHLTGWWDIFTDGQIETWNLMKQHLDPTKRSKYLQKLIIGPWAHQTVGGRITGDMEYKENVSSILGIELGAFSETELPLASAVNSELIQWYRYNLNYDSTQFLGEPKAFIKASTEWSSAGLVQVRVPAEDYKIPLNDLISFLTGATDLPGLKVAVRAANSTDPIGTIQVYDIPATGEPLITGLEGGQVSTVEYKDFDAVPDIRFYVVGPVNDGTTVNDAVGNYWYGADEFPLTTGVQWQDFYLHKNGTVNTSQPTTDEGFSMYLHNPDDPIQTIGGANMIVRTPDGLRDSQGQFNLKEWAEYTMDRPGVIQFETEVLQDTLCVVGFPEATIYAKSNPSGVTSGPTDTDFFVRVVDVYPDGRELYVVEGCVNARARNYARSIVEGQEDDNAVFENINIGEIYEYSFRMMPIGYTFGKEHKMKILISSSNYPRYQSNPNLPIEPNEFFRRRPGDGRTYTFEGEEMAPRVAINRIAFSPEYASRIKLPVLNEPFLGLEKPSSISDQAQMSIYPNPTQNEAIVYMNYSSEFSVSLYDLSGKEISSTLFQGEQTTVNLNSLKSGIYLVTVKDAKNGNQMTSRVIKN